MEVATARIVTPAQAASASSSMSPEHRAVPSPPVAGCRPGVGQRLAGPDLAGHALAQGGGRRPGSRPRRPGRPGSAPSAAPGWPAARRSASGQRTAPSQPGFDFPAASIQGEMSPSDTAVPNVQLTGDVAIPQLGFGVFQIPPEETVEATLRAFETGYRHIDTAAAYRNEAEVGQAFRASGPGPRRGVHHHQVLQRLARLRAGQAGLPGQHRPAGAGVRRPVPDPLAGAVPGQVRGDLEGVHRAAGAGPDPLHRRVQLPARPPAPDHRRDRRDAVGEPDRAAPALPAGRPAARARRPRHRDRGLEPAGPGRGARRPGR